MKQKKISIHTKHSTEYYIKIGWAEHCNSVCRMCDRVKEEKKLNKIKENTVHCNNKVSGKLMLLTNNDSHTRYININVESSRNCNILTRLANICLANLLADLE